MSEQLQKIMDESRTAVFFGGAGVSTESGIPDFRSTDGLYNQKYDYPPETILSHTFLVRHTAEFYRFYRDKMLYVSAVPNAAHKKLAEWEQSGRLAAIITQNIDGLHQAAGSRNVMELHGSVHRNYCTQCHKFFNLDFMLHTDGVPLCDRCGGVVKPDVVLYEEPLDDATVSRAVDALRRADTLIVAGTSLTVYPAAGLIRYFSGRNLVLINRDRTPYDASATLVLHEKVGQVLGALH